jgi:hypothetical protein
MDTPPVPSFDFDTAKQTAQNIHDTLISLFQSWSSSGDGTGPPGFVQEMIASSVGGIMFVVAFVVLILMQTIIAIGSWAAASFLNLIDDAKQENQDNINSVLAASCNEMLGTNLDSGDLSSGTGSSSMDENAVLGDALLNIFEQTFGGGGQPVSPDQGAQNARKFAGFGINFATSQGFISILAEACSLGFLKEFHELPEALMKALGLSRLQRLALQPLIQNAIQKPYQKYCMAQYRPTQLAEAQLVRALHSGQMDEGDVTNALQQLGYSDELISFVLTDFDVKLSTGDLWLLMLNGNIDQQDVINNLTLTGMPEAQAQNQLIALDLAASRTEQGTTISWAADAYINGFIDEGTWSKVLDNSMLGDLQEQNLRTRVGYQQENPRKRASFADVKGAIVANIIGYDYLDTWLTAEGYDQDTQNILSWQVLEAIKTAEQKVEFAQYKAKVLVAAKKPVPPWISAAATPVT